MLRRTRPELKRSFRTPLVPLVPILSVLASLYLMLNLSAATWERFLIWMAAGFVIYFFYSRSRSTLAPGYRRPENMKPLLSDSK